MFPSMQRGPTNDPETNTTEAQDGEMVRVLDLFLILVQLPEHGPGMVQLLDWSQCIVNCVRGR